MNLRQYTIALLISALPLLVLADAKITLNSGDFIAAEKISKDGETILSVKLSKSGKAKFKKLNKSSLNQDVRSQIAGVLSKFKLRAPIDGNGLELGPFSTAEASRIAAEINQNR